MAGLAATGETSYNGIPFAGATNARVSVQPMMDEANRVVSCLEVTIFIEGIIAVSDETADLVNALAPALGEVELGKTLERVRDRLEQRGKTLIFNNRGFANTFEVNALDRPATTTVDLKGGPFPQVLEWTPTGDNKAASFAWSVKTYVKPGVLYANVVGNPIMEFNYEISFEIDDGWTTRTISGYLQIIRLYSTNGVNNPAFPNGKPLVSVDEYWENIICEPLKGFKRKTSRKANQDKTRLDFTVVDTELRSRNPYPQRVVNIEAKHRVNWRMGGGQGAKLFSSITATIECEPTAPIETGYAIFNSIVKKRLVRIEQQASKIGKNFTPFIFDYEVEEDIFGNRDSFAIRFWSMGALQDFLCGTGLWTPVDTDWDKWRTSLSGSVFSKKGNAETYHNSQYEAIISLDNDPTTRQPIAGSTPAVREKYKSFDCSCLKNNTPTPARSYIDYRNQITAVKSQPTVRQAIIQAPLQESSGQSMTGTGLPNMGSQAPTSDILQVGGAPQHTYHLFGKALRAGYPVPNPTLQSVTGISATLIKDVFNSFIIANLFGVPVYAANWSKQYALDNSQGSIMPPANPYQQVDMYGKSEEICKDAKTYNQ